MLPRLSIAITVCVGASTVVSRSIDLRLWNEKKADVFAITASAKNRVASKEDDRDWCVKHVTTARGRKKKTEKSLSSERSQLGSQQNPPRRSLLSATRQ